MAVFAFCASPHPPHHVVGDGLAVQLHIRGSLLVMAMQDDVALSAQDRQDTGGIDRSRKRQARCYCSVYKSTFPPVRRIAADWVSPRAARPLQPFPEKRRTSGSKWGALHSRPPIDIS